MLLCQMSSMIPLEMRTRRYLMKQRLKTRQCFSDMFSRKLWRLTAVGLKFRFLIQLQLIKARTTTQSLRICSSTAPITTKTTTCKWVENFEMILRELWSSRTRKSPACSYQEGEDRSSIISCISTHLRTSRLNVAAQVQSCSSTMCSSTWLWPN